MLAPRSSVLTPSAMLLRRSRVSRAIGTYYDFTGSSLPSPWDTLRRAGLGTRIDAAGAVGYGAHNLLPVSRSDAGWLAAGTTAPTVTSGQTQGGRGCTLISFPALATGGFGASRAQRTLNTQATVTAGLRYTWRAKVWLSRALSPGEALQCYMTGAFGLVTIPLTSSTPAGQWIDIADTAGLTVGVGGQIYPVIFAGSGLSSPVDVWTCDWQLNQDALQSYLDNTTTAPVYLPRPTHNPSTLAALGLLIEGQATNILGATEDLANAAWLKQQSTAPTADTLQEDSSSALHRAVQTVAGASGLPYAFSGWVAAGTRTFVQVSMSDNATGSAGYNINLSTGASSSTLSGSWSGLSALTIEAMTRNGVAGWYFGFVATKGAGTTVVAQVNIASALGTVNYPGNGTGTIRAANLDIKQAAALSSYIPNPGTGTALRQGDFAGGGITGAALAALLPGSPEVLGPELHADPWFDSPGAWASTAGIVVSGGQAVATALVANGGIWSANSVIAPNKTYKCVLVCSSISSGSFKFVAEGGIVISAVFSTAGTHTFYVPATTAGSVYVVAETTLTATFDSFSIKEVITAAIPGPQLPFTLILPFRKANNAASVETLLGLCAGASAGTTNQLGIATQGTQAQLVHSGGSGALTGTLVLDGSTVNKVAVSVDPTFVGSTIFSADFSAGIAGWASNNNAVLTQSGNRLRVTNNVTDFGFASISFSAVVGRTYRLTFSAYVGTSGNTRLTVGNSPGNASALGDNNSSDVVDKVVYFTANTSTTFIALICNTTADTAFAEFANITVTEVGRMSISVNGSAPVETTGIAYTGAGTTAAILGARDSSGGQPATGFTSPGIRVASGYITGSALQSLST